MGGVEQPACRDTQPPLKIGGGGGGPGGGGEERLRDMPLAAKGGMGGGPGGGGGVDGAPARLSMNGGGGGGGPGGGGGAGTKDGGCAVAPWVAAALPLRGACGTACLSVGGVSTATVVGPEACCTGSPSAAAHPPAPAAAAAPVATAGAAASTAAPADVAPRAARIAATRTVQSSGLSCCRSSAGLSPVWGTRGVADGRGAGASSPIAAAAPSASPRASRPMPCVPALASPVILSPLPALAPLAAAAPNKLMPLDPAAASAAKHADAVRCNT